MAAMTYEVTYRAKDGHEACEPFEAESRDELFKALAAKGISPIRVAATAGKKARPARAGSKGKTRPSRARLVTWAAVGVAFSICAFFVAKHLEGGREADDGQDEVGRQKQIVEVAPKIPTKPAEGADKGAEEAKEEEKEDRNSLEWLKKHDKRYIVPEDAVRRPNGRLYTKDGRRILEKLPARTLQADPGRKIVFNHQAEREIARLLSIEPGKFFVGNSNYGPRFQRSFLEAVESPTPILEDDDEATVALKKEVNEVKADLARRLEAGEDIVKIMKDAESELRTLATFRQDMMKDLTALRMDESVTEQDYKDYVEAANAMLRERGLRELSLPVFAEAQLKYIREVHKAKQAAKAEREAAQQKN